MAHPAIDASPPELSLQPATGLQWWYYSGHVQGGGRRFAFAQSFFRIDTERPELPRGTRRFLSWWLSGECRAAHLAILDLDSLEFHYAHRRDGPRAAGASPGRHRVWNGDWMAAEHAGVHHLNGRMRQAELRLQLHPQKPLVRHGGDGWIAKGSGETGFHCSFPRMEAIGTLSVRGERWPVAGTAWMDREFGNWRLCPSMGGWDWCCLQFDDGRELMAYVVRDAAGRASPSSFITGVDVAGTATTLAHAQFRWRSLGGWRSRRTGTVYPARWQLSAPALEAELEITPVCPHQELDARGSTLNVYWEGAAAVTGTFAGRQARGRAFVELFGYDRSHTAVSPWKWLGWEWLRRRYGPGQTLRPTERPAGPTPGEVDSPTPELAQ